MEKYIFSLLLLVSLLLQAFANSTIKVSTPTSKGKQLDFIVNENISQDYPELIKLILKTESMDDEER